MKKAIILVFSLVLLSGCVTTRTTKFYSGKEEVARIEAYGAGVHSMEFAGNKFSTDSKTSNIFADAAKLLIAQQSNKNS